MVCMTKHHTVEKRQDVTMCDRHTDNEMQRILAKFAINTAAGYIWPIKLENSGCDGDFSIERVCWVCNAIENMAAIKTLCGKIKPTASKK